MIRILLLLLVISNSILAYENINTYEDHKNYLKTNEVLGHDMSYIDEGSGEPILLMHGIPTNSWMYRKLIPGLIQAGYRVIAPDLMGMGQSEKVGIKSELLVPKQAQYVDELIKQLGITETSLVVHDFGGPISFEMLSFSSVKVKDLIILDTFAFQEGFTPGLNIFTKMGMGLMTTRPFRKTFWCKAIESMVNNKSIATQDMLDGYLEPLLNGASYTYKKLYFSVNKLKKTSNLSEYQATLKNLDVESIKVIWGKNDAFLNSELQVNAFKELLNLDDESVTILEDAKHIITEEQPEAIVNIIIN